MKRRQLAPLAFGLLALLFVGSATASEEATVEAKASEEEWQQPTHYWWNDVTAESQWEKPEYEFTDPETDRTYYVHPETKETSWDKYEELQWVEVEGDDGTPYYYNEATKESLWEKPIMLAWRQVAVDAQEEGTTLPPPGPKDEL